MLWQDSQQLSNTLEAIFTQILQQRMLGLPVVNPVLSVQAIGFRQVNGEWLGMLITPWFMNLILIPGERSAWSTLTMGSKFKQAFPYGFFEFTLAYHLELGCYGQCSLFSPMFQFADQQQALTAAQSALQSLLTSQPNTISRRDLLRGAIGSGRQ